MVTCYFIILFFVSISLEGANSITNGHQVSSHKRYVVYLLQDKKAPILYESWLCGGVIIHQNYILTAASCLAVGRRVYVISGYNKYVNAKNMEKDICIMKTRKKIVQLCHPSTFKVDKVFNEKEYWNAADIAIAKVNVPFDFNDQSYYNICSYPPAPIRVNYMQKYIEGGREVLSFGWGHREFYRPDGNSNDFNEEYLRYSAGQITSRDECSTTWGFDNKLKDYKNNLYSYYICVDKPGQLDEYGRQDNKYDMDNMNIQCNNRTSRTGNAANMSEMDCYQQVALRNGIKDINATTGGICQNDHGGPLVTWIGGIETLIGLATLFPISKDMRCRNPYFYTSTVCFNQIIACFIEESNIGSSRRAMNCDKLIKEETTVGDVWPL